MMRMRSILVLLAGVAIAPLPAWTQPLQLEGDAGSLTLVVEGTERAAVVAAISQRFAMEMSGTPIGDDIVSGRFAGSLGTVLKKLLPDNGFVMAYNNGRPARIVFTGKGVAVIQPGTGFDLQPGSGYVDPNTGMIDPNF